MDKIETNLVEFNEILKHKKRNYEEYYLEEIECICESITLSKRNLSKICFIGFEFRNCLFLSTIMDHTRFSFCKFENCYFEDCHMERAIFSECEFSHDSSIYSSWLKSAIFIRTSFTFIKFSDVYGYGVGFTDCSVKRMFVRGSYFNNMVIENCSGMQNIAYDSDSVGFSMRCPSEGSFVGYKKVEYFLDPEICNFLIAKLLIPEDALRSSATSAKCRCSKAVVLSLTYPDGSETDIVEAFSSYRPTFSYKVGETVEAPDFNTNRWNECSSGIHFFMNREDAVNY